MRVWRDTEPGVTLCTTDRGWSGLLSPCCTPHAHTHHTLAQASACIHVHMHTHTNRPIKLWLQLPIAGPRPGGSISAAGPTASFVSAPQCPAQASPCPALDRCLLQGSWDGDAWEGVECFSRSLRAPMSGAQGTRAPTAWMGKQSAAQDAKPGPPACPPKVSPARGPPPAPPRCLQHGAKGPASCQGQVPPTR